MIKCPELLNREWLAGRYTRDELSMEQIANELGCSPSFVRKYLLRHGIPIRNKSEAHRLHQEDDGFVLNLPILTGCLLGDGTLISQNKSSEICVPYFRKHNNNRDHVEYVSSLLFSGRTDRVKEMKRKDPSPTASPSIHWVSSVTHECLVPIYREWYPPEQGYRKVIPESVEIDEVMLLHWFMDDGTTRTQDLKSGRRVVVRFCSECFIRDEQEALCEKINRRYDLHATTTCHRKGTAYRIMIPQTKAADFFEIIGPPPVPSLAYKWKLDGHTWDATHWKTRATKRGH